MKAAQWIWYPRDFELMLARRMMAKRYFREVIQPPIWRVDGFWNCVKFAKAFTLREEDEIEIRADGSFHLELDAPGAFVKDFGGTLKLGAGEHTLCVAVFNSLRLPALYLRGRELVSDGSWLVTCQDGKWLPAGCWNFFDPDRPPHDFSLPERDILPVGVQTLREGTLVDFGRETFGRAVLEEVEGEGTVRFSFGESEEEALDVQNCEQTDLVKVRAGEVRTVHPLTKAFRYVLIRPEGVKFGRVSGRWEYLPLERKSRFRCDDELVNRIWEVSLDTLELCSREFFVDGIKRDRWIWSGDAVQSCLMNYYSFFDRELVKRTIAALRGKDPVVQHVNTIMDYSFYWLIGLADYLRYTGDTDFVKEYWERAESLLRFCLGRRSADGFIRKYPEDWVFVDWSEGIDNEGIVCCEQMLLAESLKRMSSLAAALGEGGKAEEFAAEAKRVDEAVEAAFWDEQGGFYRYSIREEGPNPALLKHPNLFALKFGLCTEERKRRILGRMDAPGVPPVTTPYMRFYEYEVLCGEGRHRQVLDGIRSYWGGMLEEGATSFWEIYRPGERGKARFEMYSRPYGRSLCHAWGAAPVYLLGRFFAGVEPSETGCERFRLSPHLGGLKFFEAEMPTATGRVRVGMDETSLFVRAEGTSGELAANEEFSLCGTGGAGRIRIEEGRDYRIPIQIKKKEMR